MSVKNNKVKNTLNLMRHSERSEESMDPSVGYASLKDDNRMGQRGRSMVEMLGVLAIVGVLSVGGVYGYGVAMKKHKANELLHRASMLASTVSAQIMSGKEPTTLDTFADSNLGKFALDYDPTKTTFDLAISEMDSAICTQMEKMAGGIVRQATCNDTTATLTYYKNLATNEAEGEKSPIGSAGTEKDPACEGVECPEGTTCGVAGNCIAEKTTDGTCSNNSDCDKWCATKGDGVACYCKITADITRDDSNCWKNFAGQCAVATSEIKGGYLVSRDDMSWWSAVNFCKAFGESLVSLSDIGIKGGYQDDAGCSGSDCTGTFKWGIANNGLPDDFWVTDAVECDIIGEYGGENCRAGENNKSCAALTVYQTPRVVYSERRSYEWAQSAVCKK